MALKNEPSTFKSFVWLSEPVFYGDLVYKLKKIVGSNNFSAQLIKIISQFKKMAITLMHCNRLYARWSTQSRWTSLLSSLIARRWVGLQTLWRLRLKNLWIGEMVGAWCFCCCQTHRVLPVGFLLLWYSVLFTVESLSLLYVLFISWFMCSRLCCIDKLGVVHAIQTSMCLDPDLNLGWDWHAAKSV